MAELMSEDCHELTSAGSSTGSAGCEPADLMGNSEPQSLAQNKWIQSYYHTERPHGLK